MEKPGGNLPRVAIGLAVSGLAEEEEAGVGGAKGWLGGVMASALAVPGGGTAL